MILSVRLGTYFHAPWITLALFWTSPQIGFAQPPPVTSPLAGEDTPVLTPTSLPGDWKASLLGAAQLRIQSTNEKGSDRTPQIELRRLRVGIKFQDPSQKTLVRIMTNLTPTSPELIDAYLERKLGRLQTRVGQMKTPFTGYGQRSFMDLLSSDRPSITRVFGASRQLGLQAAIAPDDDSGWYGAAGIFQGTALRASDDHGVASLYGKSIISYVNFRDARALDSVHPELNLRLGHRWALSKQGEHLDLELSARHDFSPNTFYDLQDVGAIEGSLEYERLSFLGIGYGGLAKLADKKNTALVSGLFAQIGIRISHQWIPSLGISQVNWSSKLQKDAEEFSRSSTENTTVALSQKSEPKPRGERTITLSLRWNAAARLTFWVEGVRAEELREDGDKQVFRARLQGQVAFLFQLVSSPISDAQRPSASATRATRFRASESF